MQRVLIGAEGDQIRVRLWAGPRVLERLFPSPLDCGELKAAVEMRDGKPWVDVTPRVTRRQNEIGDGVEYLVQIGAQEYVIFRDTQDGIWVHADADHAGGYLGQNREEAIDTLVALMGAPRRRVGRIGRR